MSLDVTDDDKSTSLPEPVLTKIFNAMSLGPKELINPPPEVPAEKLPAISQKRFSDAILWMKSFLFWLKFHWGLFLRFYWQQPTIGLDTGLAPNWRQAVIWPNADPIHWRIYAAIAGNELTLFIVRLDYSWRSKTKQCMTRSTAAMT